MARQKVTAIFDIGKTNKKFFLFDSAYQVVYKEYKYFEEIKDASGFPTENLKSLEEWLKTTLKSVLTSPKYELTKVNFSTYGASFVHLDKAGNVLTPLYNYLKPIPAAVLEAFYKTYGPKETLEESTGAPISGNLLNSGLQLYWLKKTHPKVFSKIARSVHFPQYLSYLFTGVAFSEFTSIGCHTALWDFDKGTYHDWVQKEGFETMLPPLLAANSTMVGQFEGTTMTFGIGIHDSSATLLPYYLNEKKPFVLVSTGTWSIALNPFYNKLLTEKDLQHNVLNYMMYDGRPVRAARLFLGGIYKKQVALLTAFFKKPKTYHISVSFQEDLYRQLLSTPRPSLIQEVEIGTGMQAKTTDLTPFASFEEAYHQLMIELVAQQENALRTAIGDSPVQKVYIDGGFVDNELFTTLLALRFPDLKIRTTISPLGSALGAAMVLSEDGLPNKFLKRAYQMKKLKPQKRMS